MKGIGSLNIKYYKYVKIEMVTIFGIKDIFIVIFLLKTFFGLTFSPVISPK